MTKTVLLTSFQQSRQDQGQDPYLRFSISRWQPAGFAYPELSFLAPWDAAGRPIRLRDFAGSLSGYHDALWQRLVEQRDKVEEFLDYLSEYSQFALCCWCPYSRPAQRQIKQFGTFVCHSMVVKPFLEQYPGVSVQLDDDRRTRAVILSGPVSEEAH